MFCDNHGVERSNSINSSVVDAALNEWHYDKFGIMHQHYRGKENNSGFKVMHEVRPALMFTLALQGFGSKNVYQGEKQSHELVWNTGDANICFINGEGGLQVNLHKNLSLDLLSIVIPQPFIESLIAHNAQLFECFAAYALCQDNTHLFFNTNRPVEPSLHELAVMVGTNECTLKKAFKHEFGTTIFQYLFDYRMELAAHYLLDTNLPIADIGMRLGYDYQSHCCTAFKRKFGVSPIAFRLRR